MPSILKALASEFHKMGQLLNMLLIHPLADIY